MARSRTHQIDLLSACLACWVDFWFVPEPKPLVIDADHDELTTLLGMRAAGVNRAAERLEASGFAERRGFVRKCGRGERHVT